jgi:uroporphyrin-III C-methyltransferase
VTQQVGKVYLVGAGPGDPELLTLAAARALREADVVLVDDLVNRAILAHARPDVRIVPVGKRGGLRGDHRSTPQAFIERLMLQEAHAGHTVVRLKGGDPFLFGRGGEEAAHLRAAGLEVTVIPGVTSGIAAPMAAGISVTHRDSSPGVIFVTGHEKDGAHERVDWSALAASGLTLVIYMGLTNAGRIQGLLLQAGRADATPIAVISNATLASQRVVTGTLGTLAETIRTGQIESPAILVIGDVARAAEPGTPASVRSGTA